MHEIDGRVTLHFSRFELTEVYIKKSLTSKFGKVLDKLKLNDLSKYIMKEVNILSMNNFRLTVEKDENNMTAVLYAVTENNKIGNIVRVWNSGFILL